MDLHCGNISVHSEGLGFGSSFTVELPMGRSTRYIPTAMATIVSIDKSMRNSQSPTLMPHPESVRS